MIKKKKGFANRTQIRGLKQIKVMTDDTRFQIGMLLAAYPVKMLKTIEKIYYLIGQSAQSSGS